MRRIVFITPGDARPGFALAGFQQRTSTIAGIEEALHEVLSDPETRVAVVDERLLAGMAEERFKEMGARWPGVLVVLPAPEQTGAEAGEDYALRIIRKAIGYHVRLQR
ncbi:MAG: V-type ATP synthase subunit F [Oryzomonas sp.]|uniref:V-type ATP synthase subunit F n=1 Tax=Oryzomonas sp. TaxID=2855186 RepID=UPI0028400F37|nr:V-type ATP synthase subunit F [Oryzomonas sp.]MDR3578692.1 V-type ATP synthase subunit F [Oryzomonas sp.]